MLTLAAVACCAAGLTLPFAVRALIESSREPEVKHPPTVKEVRLLQ
jgi:hypothetical protein